MKIFKVFKLLKIALKFILCPKDAFTPFKLLGIIFYGLALIIIIRTFL